MLFEDMPLLRAFQAKMKEMPYEWKQKHLGLMLCHTPAPQNKGAVIAISESDEKEVKKRAKIIGLSRCGNTWLCPVCSVELANKMSQKVQTAIDLEKKAGHVPIMLTLTIPHYKHIPLKLCIETLKECWRYYFTQANNKISNGYKRKTDRVMNGVKHDENYKYSRNDIWSQFRRLVHHYFRANEITVSRFFGWHPHSHILLFVDKESLPKLQEMEKELCTKWTDYAYRTLVKKLEKEKPNLEKELENVNCTFEELINHLTAVKSISGSNGAHFSKDTNGTIRTFTAASYAAGLSSHLSNELTGQSLKRGRKSKHYTPIQLIEMVCRPQKYLEQFISSDEEENKDEDTESKINYYWKLIVELIDNLHGTKNHRVCLSRFVWSKTDLTKRLKQFEKTEEFLEYKKKFGAKDTSQKWKIVAFVPSELLKLCFINGYWHKMEVEFLQLLKDDRLSYETICEVFDSYKLPRPLKTFSAAVEYLEDGQLVYAA